MEGNRRPFPRKRPNPQFKKKGGNKKGKWNSSSHEQSSGHSNAPETVYRILCQSKKIGSVIGKGGCIVKTLRDETRSKITVAESVPGSDERVIIVYSNSNKIPIKHSNNNSEEDLATDKEEDDLMEPHCAAQDALMKVHDRIIDEDLVGGTDNEDGNDIVVTARLLVPDNMVGCVLGKKGDVIQRLRSETGASIRVLPSDHLPTCAMSTDELVQISGKPAVAKRALYEVSTLLHQNPRKDQPSPSFPMPYGGQSFHPPGPPMPNMLPPGNPMWSQRNPDSHIPPMPWMGGYRNEPLGIGPGGFNGVPAPRGGESSSEFFMKILCSPLKIGGVIGKGGSNVRQLQQETGASIHAEDVTAESDERVIRVSCFEDPWNPRSQTIDAILQLQNLTSELSEKGMITTRLLVPSSKVGCLLGQGGHVINEMRRRTNADIRVFSKEEKPKFVAADEELVQISGSFAVAKGVLGEIASRLRERCLRDAKGGAEPGPVGPGPGFGPPGNLHVGRPPPFGDIRAGSSGGYGNLKGGRREYEPPSYPVPPSAAGYPNFNRDIEMPNNAIGPVMGPGGSITGDIGGTRVMLQDRQCGGGSECVVEIRGGSSQHLNNAYQAYMASGAPTTNPQHDPYQNYNTTTQPGAYPNINASQTPYQSANPPQDPYYNYQNISGTHQPPPYESAQGSYPHFSL